LESEFLPNPSRQTWIQNESRFKEIWNFPSAVGAIDGKHIRVKCPPASGSLYYNYKGFFSVVLLAIANADFQFSAVDIGASGSESDGGILSKSPLGKALDEDKLGIPRCLFIKTDHPFHMYFLEMMHLHCGHSS
jgi:hypothetical protein